MSGGDLAELLGFTQDGGIAIDPAIEDLFQAGPKGLALRSHLLTQVAGQTAVTALLRLDSDTGRRRNSDATGREARA